MYLLFTVPPIVTTVQPLPVVVETDVELVCIITGVDPPDNITWIFNGMEIFMSNEATGGNFTRSFPSDNYGNYTCIASNEFGTTNSTIEVIQAGEISFCNNRLPLYCYCCTCV